MASAKLQSSQSSPQLRSASQTRRICFLFNHDQTHQIAHSLPIALVLAREGLADVTIAVTSRAIEESIQSIAKDELSHLTIVRLSLRSKLSKSLTNILDPFVPASKVLLYRDNLAFFRNFDALVVSEKTSLLLKTRYGLNTLKIVHTRHGAGDRAIGFDRQSALFDLILVAGPKIARRLMNEAGVEADRIRIIGYNKFDLFGDNETKVRFENPALPIILYCPHPAPTLSSWYRMGEQVLRDLAGSWRYNVIFAPHVMLFRRKWAVTISPPAARKVSRPSADLLEHPNLLIDLGSSASTDMTYANAADIYVGDVSSQIYEFLLKPRPCLHLDAHSVNWQDNRNYRHWQTGPVVQHDGDIVAAVDHAIASHSSYLPAQKELFADTFSVEDEAASVRGAKAIIEYLNAT